uniref:Rhodopsin domain-containing protein n=1 Tax=Talaromyces marneffei PM1 TaxID=1077442 RepID=A0A093V246_TALMA
MSGTDLPALGSPSGMTPNFTHPRDALRTILFVTQCLCIPIVSILVVLRLYVRFRFQQQLGVDEYFSFVAWVMLTAGSVSKHGGGCYQWELYRSEVVEFLKISYIATLFYAPMALFVKVALLTLLARVFKPYRKWVIFIYVNLGVILTYPVSAYWNGTDSGGSCLNQGKVIVADSVMSVVTDLAILILPLPLTWSLQMPLEKKLKVIGLLSAGGLATGFSLYRLVMIVQDGQSPDQTMVFTRVVHLQGMQRVPSD